VNQIKTTGTLDLPCQLTCIWWR